MLAWLKSLFSLQPLRLFLAGACLLLVHLPVQAQNRNLTAVVLVNSQNASGYNTSATSPGEFQRFTERYLEHLQLPYELFDVATAAPPADLDSRQLVIAGHSRLSLPASWRDAIAAAVSGGTGFVNLDSDTVIGNQSHIAAIFGATGSAAGTAATQISVPPAVAPGGATPHYITALQKRYDGPNNFVYTFHAGADGIVRTATSTVLQNAQGTVIARLGNDPLILVTTHGAGRAVHFGTLDYLRGDRFGFVQGIDDLFWRSLVWAARKPFVLRGYPRLWAVQIDDTRAGFGTRVRDMYDTAFTGTASGDGLGGPWKVTGYLFTDNLPAGNAERAGVISDINAGRLEVFPHSFADMPQGNMYWDPNSGPLTDQQWQTKMNGIDAWKQGNGGADVIPSFSRAMVAHFWHLSDNTGNDLWNRYGVRYMTSILRPGFWARRLPDGSERIPAKSFWNYEMPPKTFEGSFTSEDYHFFFSDDYVVRSRAGLPPQTFFLFATQYLDFAKYGRVDFAWPNALGSHDTVPESLAQLQQYTWRFWSGLAPVQLFTHDAGNYEAPEITDRRATIAQASSWLNANGVRHAFMDDLGDYIYARNKSTLTRATFDGTQLAYTFTGRAANADGTLISTQVLLFQGDTEGSWQTVPGFTAGSQVTRNLPPSIASVAPANGPVTGGTSVTITGQGFTSTSSVFFGQSAAASTTFVDSSTLQAVAPAGSQGSVEVRVVNVNGTAALPAGFTYTPPPRVLAAGYAFDEGAGTVVADVSGNGNNGTINAATWSAAGKFGKALSFNGTSSWVTIPDSAALDLTNGMTLEAWVNPTALGSTWRTALMKEQPGGLVYSLCANTNTSVPSGHVFIGSEQDTRGTAALPLNTWTHLALTYDGSTLRLFVNGTQVSSKALVGNIQTSNGALRIGGNAVWGEFFTGLIDEVRIFARTSTAAEIQSDMNAPLGDTTPPTVAMTAPANGATVSDVVTVSANANDNSAVAGVQFLLDGAPLNAEDITAPYSTSWNSATTPNGLHTLAARARDAVGNVTTSTAIGVTLANAPDTTSPTAAMTAPANGATVSGLVTLTADASDNVAVAGVQFLLDGAAVGSEDTTAPYSISWNSATATTGPHTLAARARDAANNTGTSVAINVTVVPPDTTAPLATMTAPANGTTVSGTVTVTADASDNVGVAGVQFLLDGNALGAEDTTAPYSLSWNSATVINGPHTLSARARDAAGNQTTSSAVSVTVTGGLSNGLVAAYGFNEGTGTAALDTSGSGNNGTLTATTWNAAGKFGQALSFNGTSSWVTVNDSASLDLTNGMTVEAWVNPTVLGTSWRTTVMKEQAGGLAYSLYANTNTSRPSAHVFIGSEQDIRGTAVLPLNTWTHLAMTYNGTTLRLYVNGAEVSNSPVAGNMLVSTGPLRIGGNGVWGEFFGGLIDEVRVYSRGLSATEIQTDMNTPVGGGDTTAPTVSMSAPANGATVSGLVTVSANASDNVGVAGVQFFLDGAPLGTEDTTSPYSLSWNSGGVANGPHSLSARARDAANNQTTSTAITVTVSNTPDTTPPTVSMTAPAEGATVSGSVTVSANANDNVAVAGVQFFLDGSPLGAEDTTAPYSITWNSNTATAGPHTLSARARDGAGNLATSAVVNVTVVPPDTTPPVVGMTAPANGATVTGSVTVSADASDNIGVVGVQFLLDGQALGGEDTTSPYSISWNSSTSTNGSHTLSARARDAAGNQTTSTTVSVTVSGGVVSGLALALGFSEGSGTTTADFSGNSNNGTLTNGATWATGKFGNGVNFDGINDNVTVANSTSLSLGNTGTVEAWVRLTSVGRWNAIIAKGSDNNDRLHNYGIEVTNTNRFLCVLGNGTTFRTLTSTTVATAAQFYHVACVWNGTNLQVYVNGVQDASVAQNLTPAANTAPVTIGQFGGSSDNLAGIVDEVRIYSRALSAAEVAADMNNPVGIADTTPPTVSLTTPAEGTIVSGSVPVSASASDNIGVAGVQFLLDGAALGAEDTSSPYSISWNSTGVANGAHTLAARARDAAGNQTTSTVVNVTTSNITDTTPPAVSMTAPPGGATVSGSVPVSANASDNVGVAGVQFLLDGVALGIEDTTSPYSISWNSATVANGTYNLSARARDAAGNQTTSSSITVTVSNSAPPPSTGLVAAYAFNEGSGTTVVDSSGDGNSGTAANTTWSAAGRFGAALSFNGTTSWVTVNDSPTLDLTTGLTIEAWVSPTAVGTAWRTAVMKEQATGLAYGLYANSNTSRPSGHLFVDGAEQDTRGTAALAINTWTHLAMTYNGSVLRLFVNGTEVSNKAVSGSLLTSTGALRIGGNSVWGEFFSGLIDEVRIYNRPLSTAEIQTDMNTAVPSGPPPDSSPPTVSVLAPASGTTIASLSTLYAVASDDVGVVGVQFFIDGVPFGSEGAGSTFTTTWNTATATNGSHTVTAVARDQVGNLTTSAPVTVTVSNTNDPTVVGAWTTPFAWPIVAVHMIVTRTGEIVSWDGPPSNGGTSAQLWNPNTGAFTAIPNNRSDMFCDGNVVLADGRILALGGHAGVGAGIPNADIFDPTTKLWTGMASMIHPRWYPTGTVLPDGRVLVTSGSDSCYNCMVNIPEIYNPTTNTWTALNAAATNPTFYYPLMFVLPDGRLLEAGGTETSVPTVTRVLNLATQTWTTVDPNNPEGHSAVMFEPGKIMKSGVTPDVGVSTAPSISTTYTLDMTQPSPKWQQTPNMAFPRAFHVSTLLPDGTVVTTGGGSRRDGI
ncbi:MAG: Ig-like domain-containing protein, partial [Acidobacteriales bacterium]|nr:Ig-like domain-containing protein [Terriglobales bacterium]